jgi:hypothetical protein
MEENYLKNMKFFASSLVALLLIAAVYLSIHTVSTAAAPVQQYTCYDTNEGDIEVCIKKTGDNTWKEGSQWSFYFKNVGNQTITAMSYEYTHALCRPKGVCTSVLGGQLPPGRTSSTTSTVSPNVPGVHIYKIERR